MRRILFFILFKSDILLLSHLSAYFNNLSKYSNFCFYNYVFFNYFTFNHFLMTILFEFFQFFAKIFPLKKPIAISVFFCLIREFLNYLFFKKAPPRLTKPLWRSNY